MDELMKPTEELVDDLELAVNAQRIRFDSTTNYWVSRSLIASWRSQREEIVELNLRLDASRGCSRSPEDIREIERLKAALVELLLCQPIVGFGDLSLTTVRFGGGLATLGHNGVMALCQAIRAAKEALSPTPVEGKEKSE
jgi:hypothetical protein